VNWIATHHAQIVYAVGGAFAILNFIIKVLLTFRPLTDWVAIAERRPRVAALVRLLGAIGIQPIAVAQAFVDFVRGHASPGTLADARAFQVSASRPVIAPKSLRPRALDARTVDTLPPPPISTKKDIFS
jgi:hypothetical protein